MKLINNKSSLSNFNESLFKSIFILWDRLSIIAIPMKTKFLKLFIIEQMAFIYFEKYVYVILKHSVWLIRF